MPNHSLSQAADTMFAELDRLLTHQRRIETERTQTKTQIDRLRQALSGLITLLPVEERRTAAARLAANAAHARGRPFGPHGTPRSRALKDFLDQNKDRTLTPSDYTAFLNARGLPPPDIQFAARTFSRKAKQGVLRRVDLGRYRVV